MKVGRYSLPDLRLFPDIYDDIKLIYDNYRLEEATETDTVAKLLGHKRASGGYWFSKLADMRLYGLLESRGIKLTTLAERLTYGTDQEKQEATNQAIFNIPLWKELYSNFGIKLPESNFWVQVQRVTGLDPADARKFADSVRKAYLEDVRYIKPEIEDISGDDDMSGEGVNTSITTIYIKMGPFTQTIPATVEGVTYAKGFLDLLGTQLKKNETLSEEK